MAENSNTLLLGASSAIVVLLVLAVVLGVGNQALNTIKVSQFETETRTITNESVSVTVNTYHTLGNKHIDNTTVVVSNFTGIIKDIGNWTMLSGDEDVGRINISYAGAAGDKLNVTYSYSHETRSSAYNASAKGEEGLLTFSSFQSTLAVVFALVLVVALLLGGMAVVSRMKEE